MQKNKKRIKMQYNKGYIKVNTRLAIGVSSYQRCATKQRSESSSPRINRDTFLALITSSDSASNK